MDCPFVQWKQRISFILAEIHSEPLVRECESIFFKWSDRRGFPVYRWESSGPMKFSSHPEAWLGVTLRCSLQIWENIGQPGQPLENVNWIVGPSNRQFCNLPKYKTYGIFNHNNFRTPLAMKKKDSFRNDLSCLFC